MIIIRILFILAIFPFSLSLLCKDGIFNQTLINSENNFEIGLGKEACYEYTLSSTKKKNRLHFFKYKFYFC